MLNWISSACIIVLAGQAGPLYVNTEISMVLLSTKLKEAWGRMWLLNTHRVT